MDWNSTPRLLIEPAGDVPCVIGEDGNLVLGFVLQSRIDVVGVESAVDRFGVVEVIGRFERRYEAVLGVKVLTGQSVEAWCRDVLIQVSRLVLIQCADRPIDWLAILGDQPSLLHIVLNFLGDLEIFGWQDVGDVLAITGRRLEQGIAVGAGAEPQLSAKK